MFDQIRDILVRKFRIPAEDVTPDASFEELELDSLDIVELSLALEEEVGVKLSDDELAEAGSLASVVQRAQHNLAVVQS